MKKVATLMSVYSGDKPEAFAAALDSVLQQEFNEPVESCLYLAVDGPISAELDGVIRGRQEAIFLVLRLERNRGLAFALNSLIDSLGDEEYVFRMDSDDLSYRCRFQAQLDYFARHPDTDILGTDILEVDRELGTKRRVAFARGHADAVSNLCWRVPVAHPTVCLRRRVLDHCAGYPTTGTNEDVAFWFKCARAGFRFDNVRECLLEFSVDSTFWSRRSARKAISELQCYVSGIWMMHGITWRYIFPFFRFLFRFSPRWFTRRVYHSAIRQRWQVGS